MSLLEETLEPSLVANPEARVRCQPVMTQQQRSAGETQMVQSQETHHSTEDLYAAVQSQEEDYLSWRR